MVGSPSWPALINPARSDCHSADADVDVTCILSSADRW